MRRPVTDIALLSYIGKKRANVISYSEATKACKSSSSASRALHQLIEEGLIEPQPKLVGLRYVTQYAVTARGKEAAGLALQLGELRESLANSKKNPAATTSVAESKNAKKPPQPARTKTPPPGGNGRPARKPPRTASTTSSLNPLPPKQTDSSSSSSSILRPN